MKARTTVLHPRARRATDPTDLALRRSAVIRVVVRPVGWSERPQVAVMDGLGAARPNEVFNRALKQFGAAVFSAWRPEFQTNRLRCEDDFAGVPVRNPDYENEYGCSVQTPNAQRLSE